MIRSRLAVKAIFFVNGFMYANWISRLPRIQEQFGLDNAALGTALLFTSVGAIGAMPFTGAIIAKAGSRATTLAAVLAFTLMVPLIPLLPSLLPLLGLFLLLGVSSGITDVAMNAQAVLVEKHMQRPVMTSFHALFSIGMALGAAFGSLYASLNTPLLTHLITASAVGAGVISIARPALVRGDSQSSANERKVFQLPTPSLVTVGIIAFCCMLGEGAMADWSTNFMENVSGARLSFAPWGLASFAFAMTAGRVLGDSIRVRWGDRKLLVLCSLMATAGLIMLVAVPGPALSVAASFLVGLGLSAIVPIAYSIAGHSREVSPGTGIAMVTTIGYTGFLVGPPCIGYLADWMGLRWALGVILALFALMTLLSLSRKEEG
jgi:MFS family permease